jgi:small-conductance mechanosensitive channel
VELISTWVGEFGDLLVGDRALSVYRALVLILVGYAVARVLRRVFLGLLSPRLSKHQTAIFGRLVFYALWGLFIVSALRELGFQLTALLGAAGILTVALGFASQTSASNLISGLFLLAEHPFGIGDLVRIGSTTGEVLSIDLLSVKLRTFDNLFVRIPNETLIKSEVTTLTRFPIRRADLPIGIAYKEDIERVQEILMAVADANPLCLEEPKPLFILLGFGDSAVNLQFSVWAKRENFLELKNSIQIEIKQAFDREGIEIPFPHRTIYAGSASGPIAIDLVDGRQQTDAGAR